MKNNRRALVVILFLTVLMSSACARKQSVDATETMTDVPMEQTEAVAPTEFIYTIDTKYLPLRFSEVLARSMRHVEVVDQKVTMEVFYFLTEEGEKELFRIYFGNTDQGDMIGLLDVEGNRIPITVSTCIYSEVDFATEEELKLYYSLMEELNTVIASIHSDSRFYEHSEEKTVAPQKPNSVKMSFWNVTLPAHMEVEETLYKSRYQADFYGYIADEKIVLYTICLGEFDADSLLGTFIVDGEERPVYVKNYDLVPQDDWTEEDTTSAYTMMATINDVIQVIMSSENFSEEVSNG